MKCLILRRRTLTVLACALLAAAMFALVNAPAVAEARANMAAASRAHASTEIGRASCRERV